MILSMSEQAVNFLILVAAGAAAGIMYDLVRILRRLVRHGTLLLNAEDIVFWFLFTLGIMLIILWESNGVLRFFSVAAPIIGMILYFGMLSPLFMPPATAAAGFIVKTAMVIVHIFCVPLAFIVNLFLLPIKKVKKVLYKFNKIVKRLLKKLWKYEKIASGSVFKQNIRLGKAYRCNRVEGRKKKTKK